MLDLSTRQARAEQMLKVREVRQITSTVMEVRQDGTGPVVFTGLASRTATPYDMGWYDEQIARGAFKQTLSQTPDLQLLVNHAGLPLARTTIPAGQHGSLDLREDHDGLQFEARCDPEDPDVRTLRSKVQSGLMDQCSFAFRVIRQQWTWTEDSGDERDAREIQEVSLDRGDVSVCNYGANPATGVTARALAGDLTTMTDEQLDELREDPSFLFVLRRLGITPPEASSTTDQPTALSADLARARAWVLSQHR